jgi:hypothetical protein
MPITGTERPDSPQISKATISNRIHRRNLTYGRYDDWESEMPTPGDYDATYGYFRSYQSAPRGPYIDVSLTYDTEGTGVNFQPGDGDEEFFANSTGREVPLEKHGSYLTKWNHFLYYRNNGVAKTIAADFPGYDAATDLSDLAGNKELIWSKQLIASPKWVLLAEPTKPGVYAYLQPAITVTRRSWWRSQGDAEGDLADVVKRVVPDEAFGATPSTAANWLVWSCDTEHDGRYWVATSVYLHSPEGWDTDLYSTP